MRLTIAEVRQAIAQGVILLDIRKSTSFGGAFIPGSINIGLTPSSSNWLTMVVSAPAELVLVTDYEAEAAAAAEQFDAAGYTVLGFLDGGVAAWASAGQALDYLPQLSVHSLRDVLDKYPDHLLLDVRTGEERSNSPFERARHAPLAELLTEGLRDVSTAAHVTTFCGSGYRANIAGSFLKSVGFRNVYSVLGGITAWRAAFGQ